jgi:predicted transcriptional regulator
VQNSLARIDLRHPEMIRIRMRAGLDYATNQNAGQILAKSYDVFNRGAAGGKQITKL